METVKLVVGSITTGTAGITLDTTREVVFEGVKLAVIRQAGLSKGHITDSRGTIATLYKTTAGRLIVYLEEWSHWQGEPDVYSLQEVSKEDLQGTGRFAVLGAKAGLSCPLTLNEALDLGVELPEDIE